MDDNCRRNRTYYSENAEEGNCKGMPITKFTNKPENTKYIQGGREIPRYSHADFIEATDCADMVFNPISEIIRKQEIGMCDLYE